MMIAQYRIITHLMDEASQAFDDYTSQGLDEKRFARKMESVLARMRDTNTRYGRWCATCYSFAARLTCPSFKSRLH